MSASETTGKPHPPCEHTSSTHPQARRQEWRRDELVHLAKGVEIHSSSPDLRHQKSSSPAFELWNLFHDPVQTLNSQILVFGLIYIVRLLAIKSSNLSSQVLKPVMEVSAPILM